MTKHAEARMQQRGIKNSVVNLLLKKADVEKFAGAGCLAISLSPVAADDALADGCDLATVEAARKVILVTCDGSLVTVLRDKGRAGRRYRRQFPTRKHRDARQRRAA